MLSNLHTHTTFCDGKNTPEEIVIHAIERGFVSIGFSGHGYTPYDLRYCMKDTDSYIAEIQRLKNKYKSKIQIYLGIEEDAFSPEDRSAFDYVIGSSHYIKAGGNIYPFDSNYSYFESALEYYNNDPLLFAESYYSAFCDYLMISKPDIIGHFDLVTKFDETKINRFLSDKNYLKIAEKYVRVAISCGSIFEVNTGLMSRGFRTAPCPSEDLLYIIKKEGGAVTVTSDAHVKENLDFAFGEVERMLKGIGFDSTYVLFDNKWTKNYI